MASTNGELASAPTSEAVQASRKRARESDPLSSALVFQDEALDTLRELPLGLTRLKLLGCKMVDNIRVPPLIVDLVVRDCGLKVIPTLPATIRRLDVSFNQLHQLQRLPVGLEVLHATDNRISRIMGLPKFVRHLDMSRNRLTNFYGMLVYAKEVYFQDNELEHFDLCSNSLLHMDLRGNRLKELPLKRLPGLVTLIADDNPLEEIIGRPPSLRTLSVKGCPNTRFESSTSTNVIR